MPAKKSFISKQVFSFKRCAKWEHQTGFVCALFILFFTLASCKNQWLQKGRGSEPITPQEAASQENSTDDPASDDTPQIFILHGSVIIGEGAAIPNIFVEDSDPSRSATPTIPSSTVEYFVYAKNTLNVTIEGTFGSDSTANCFSIPLIYGQSWTITAGMRNKTGDKEEFLTASVGPTLYTFSDTTTPINLYPEPATDGKGDVELTMTVPPSITQVSVNCISENASAWNAQLDWTAGDPDTPTDGTAVIKTSTANTNKISTGIYKIRISFKKGSETVYETTQSINIFKGLITNYWQDSSTIAAANRPIKDDGTFVLTEHIIKEFSTTNFYVGTMPDAATPSNTNSGHYNSPLATLDEAIARIAENGSSSKDYTIHISGRQKPDASATSGFSIPYSMNGKFLHLTITGVNDVDTDIIDGDNRFTALTIATSQGMVSVENLTITNGRTTSYVGGGICKVNPGNLWIDNCVITGNKAIGANAHGGGVAFTNSGNILYIGKVGSVSTVKIINNLAGTSDSTATENNVWFMGTDKVGVLGRLKTGPNGSQIGITRENKEAPITSGFAQTNGSTNPGDIFISDDPGYIIVEDADGEAKFKPTAAAELYLPEAYEFTFTIDKTHIPVHSPSFVTVVPSVTRTESDGTKTTLYYSAYNRKLYKDSSFTQLAGSNNQVTWSASLLWNGTAREESLASRAANSANCFVIPAQDFEDSYSLHAVATYMGYAHDANFDLVCDMADEEVSLPETTTVANLSLSGSEVFNGRSFKFPIATGKSRLIASDHEVTQGEYETYCRYVETQPSTEYGVGYNYPAYNVNWYDAIVYCNLRTIYDPQLGLEHCAYSLGEEKDPRNWNGIQETDGKYCGPSSNNADWNGITFNIEADGWRLPTEAEWEFLARGGNLTSIKKYSGTDSDDELQNYAWYSGTPGVDGKTHAVKGLLPNDIGLYDMSGNVWEWCWDWRGDIDAQTGVTGASTGARRCTRGGSIENVEANCTAAWRGHYSRPYELFANLGFRVVRSSD